MILIGLCFGDLAVIYLVKLQVIEPRLDSLLLTEKDLSIAKDVFPDIGLDPITLRKSERLKSGTNNLAPGISLG